MKVVLFPGFRLPWQLPRIRALILDTRGYLCFAKLKKLLRLVGWRVYDVWSYDTCFRLCISVTSKLLRLISLVPLSKTFRVDSSSVTLLSQSQWCISVTRVIVTIPKLVPWPRSQPANCFEPFAVSKWSTASSESTRWLTRTKIKEKVIPYQLFILINSFISGKCLHSQLSAPSEPRYNYQFGKPETKVQ